MIYNLSKPKLLRTAVQLPSSKSIANRTLIISSLCGTRVSELGHIKGCDDTDVLMHAISNLGSQHVFDIGAAGTAMRFLTARLAITPGEHVITGSKRMQQRPIALLVNALRELGADITYVRQEGFPPLSIKGKSLSGGCITLEGNVSSQYISALLLIAPTLQQGLTLKLTGTIISRPYIDMTLKLMQQWGADAGWCNDDTIIVKPQPYVQPAKPSIERDWSAAAFWLEITALYNLCTDKPHDASVLLRELTRQDSQQGDSRAAAYFEQLGVQVASSEGGMICSNSGQRAAKFEYDFTSTPDLAQAVIVTCCLLNTRFRISGLQSLRIKETDRIAALQKELRKLGYIIKEEEAGTLIWDGQRCTEADSPVIDTYYDHRMAMAFAPVALALGNIKINEPMVVTKSYPTFWQDLEACGFTITSLQ